MTTTNIPAVAKRKSRYWRGIFACAGMSFVVVYVWFLSQATYDPLGQLIVQSIQPIDRNNIPKAEVGLSISEKDSAVIYVKTAPNAKVIVTRKDGSPFSEDEHIQADEIIEYLTTEIEAGRSSVLFYGDEDVLVVDGSRLMNLVRDAFDDLNCAYIAVMNNQDVEHAH